MWTSPVIKKANKFRTLLQRSRTSLGLFCNDDVKVGSSPAKKSYTFGALLLRSRTILELSCKEVVQVWSSPATMKNKLGALPQSWHLKILSSQEPLPGWTLRSAVCPSEGDELVWLPFYMQRIKGDCWQTMEKIGWIIPNDPKVVRITADWAFLSNYLRWLREDMSQFSRFLTFILGSHQKGRIIHFCKNNPMITITKG